VIVSKSVLQRSLRAFHRFDPTGSPFIGLQWGDGVPLFHRSGTYGLIESLGYDRSKLAAIISLPHLLSTLTDTAVDQVDLSLDRNGVLCVVGMGSGYTDDLRVYTVRQNITWSMSHDIAEQAAELDPSCFKSINTSPFTLESPPVLRRNKLMLATAYGIVMRSDVQVDAYPYPREAFLRTISTLNVEKLYTTRGGYWGAVADGVRVLVVGHRAGDRFFDTYSVDATPIAELPAERLVGALKSAADRADTESAIEVDPVNGLSVRDEYGNTNRFTIECATVWPSFKIKPRTARTLHDALSQDKSATVYLQQMDPTTLRMVRGNWEVSFKGYDSTKATAGR
jgi:hypothetical protein